MCKRDGPWFGTALDNMIDRDALRSATFCVFTIGIVNGLRNELQPLLFHPKAAAEGFKRTIVSLVRTA